MNALKLVSWVVFSLLVINCQAGPAGAAKKAEAEEYLTKGEAVMLISASDFMKKKIGELLSWTIGYDINKVSRVRLTPTINYVKAVPRKVPPDGRTVLEIVASVDDPGGLVNIAGVRADLSSIGRLPNTMLVDNGLFGDQTANDGVYSLQTSVANRIGPGPKDIPVAVANKKGWLALAKTSLDIRKDPVIVEIGVAPERALAEEGTLVTISVRIDNPGRLEDVRSVTIDLTALGLSDKTALRNDGLNGDVVPTDDIWTLRFNLPRQVAPGRYTLPVEAANLAGGKAAATASLAVGK
jgi:hypothetical protein